MGRRYPRNIGIFLPETRVYKKVPDLYSEKSDQHAGQTVPFLFLLLKEAGASPVSLLNSR